MKRQHIGLLIIWLLFLLGIRITAVAAQGTKDISESGNIPLQIQLRYSDGTAVSDEPITLQRLPDLQESICITDSNGRCDWHVARGLYQVIFSQPLDNISSLAVAEGGLHGFGLTVGNTPITYHFTFHHDAHVYFDAAPEAAVPDPIIPTADSLHGGIVPTAVAITATVPVTTAIAAIPLLPAGHAPSEIPSTPTTQAHDDFTNQPTNPLWRLLLIIILGLALGLGLHLWSRKRQQTAEQMAEQSLVEQRIAAFVLSPQTGADVSPAAHPSTQTGGSEC